MPVITVASPKGGAGKSTASQRKIRLISTPDDPVGSTFQIASWRDSAGLWR